MSPSDAQRLDELNVLLKMFDLDYYVEKIDNDPKFSFVVRQQMSSAGLFLCTNVTIVEARVHALIAERE